MCDISLVPEVLDIAAFAVVPYPNLYMKIKSLEKQERDCMHSKS
jgi:hypothetical protein